VPYPEKKSYNRVSINFNENAGKILSESSLPPTIWYCCRQGIHCCVRPQPLMNKDIKAKDNKQKPKDARPAHNRC